MLYDQMTKMQQLICKLIAEKTGFIYPDIRYVFCQTGSLDRTLEVVKVCIFENVGVIQGLKEVAR